MKAEQGNYLLAVGVMTGNSLDGVDCVLTKFDEAGTITDLHRYHAELPADLVLALRHFRQCVESARGHVEQAVTAYESKASVLTLALKTFDDLLDAYNNVVADGVKMLVKQAKENMNCVIDKIDHNEIDLDEIDLIGLHGQTCAHYPPAIAGSKDPKSVYTVQIADGQKLADMTGISVVYDFRSDDIMNGGEGAPLAPMHHAHLACSLKQEGRFPVAFCNAGNTGNISVLTTDKQGNEFVLGWDTGPFNHFSDQVMRQEKGMPFDPDGLFGARGSVNLDLLEKLYEHAVVTKDGSNFLQIKPPKSSDPSWYRWLTELDDFSFAERLSTVQYFSAYAFVLSLTLLPKNLDLPLFFALCGGGWKNQNIRRHFCRLLQDNLYTSTCPILPCHLEDFQLLRSSMQTQLSMRQDKPSAVFIADAESFGYDGQAMEARLLADAAVCRVRAIPFSKPSITGTASDTVLGIIRFPDGQLGRASHRLKAALERSDSLSITIDAPSIFDRRWSRASAGWFERLRQARALATS